MFARLPTNQSKAILPSARRVSVQPEKYGYHTVFDSSFPFLSHSVSFRLSFPDVLVTSCHHCLWGWARSATRELLQVENKAFPLFMQACFYCESIIWYHVTCGPETSWGGTAEKVMGSRSGRLEGNVWATASIGIKLWHMDFTCLWASSPSECPWDPLCFEDAKMVRYCPSTDTRPNLRSEKCPQKQNLGCLFITMVASYCFLNLEIQGKGRAGLFLTSPPLSLLLKGFSAQTQLIFPK